MGDNETEAIFKREFMAFKEYYDGALEIYEPLMMGLFSLGLIGNVAALVTLSQSRTMSTPTFLYHRTLILAYLLFCINFFALNFLKHQFLVDIRDNRNGTQVAYRLRFVPYYVAIIYPLINSISGFLIIYMVSFIALDRVIAYLLCVHYFGFNRYSVFLSVLIIVTPLSAIVHSWAPWFQFDVVGIEDNRGEHYFTSIKSNRHNSSVYANAVVIKDVVNGSVKMLYPFLLTFLSVLTLWGAKKRRHFRQQCTRSGRIRRVRQRTESNAEILMIAVVVLAFIQVIPSEAKRIFLRAYPSEQLMASVLDQSLPLSSRIASFRILLYAYEFLKLVANLTTAIERSLACYFYIILNTTFRREIKRSFKRPNHRKSTPFLPNSVPAVL